MFKLVLRGNYQPCSMQVAYILDYENLHNRTEANFDRVSDHSISVEHVYRYVLEGGERERNSEIMSDVRKSGTLAKFDFETFF
jgi:hypothetical protein